MVRKQNDVAAFDALASAQLLSVDIEGQSVLLLRDDGTVCCIEGTYPHAGGGRSLKVCAAATASSVLGTKPRFLRGQARSWNLRPWTLSRVTGRGSKMGEYS